MNGERRSRSRSVDRACQPDDDGRYGTLDLLVKNAKEQGVLQIALEATDMGRPLYEKYGFVKTEDEMELKPEIS